MKIRIYLKFGAIKWASGQIESMDKLIKNMKDASPDQQNWITSERGVVPFDNIAYIEMMD